MRTDAEIAADAREGSPFSNGTEGYAWMANNCDECANNDEEAEVYCPILTVALLGNTPSEWSEQPWQQVKDRPEGETAPVLGGQYVCSEFSQAPEWPGDDDPDEVVHPVETVHIPVLDGQLDLLGGVS